MKYAAIVLILVLTGFVAAMAQTATNQPQSVPAATTAQQTAPPPSTASDIAKVFSDFGVNVSVSSIGFALLIGVPFIKAMCGYLRKAIPKSAQVNKLGLALAHGAGIDSPTLDTLAAEIPKPSSPAAAPAKEG